MDYNTVRRHTALADQTPHQLPNPSGKTRHFAVEPVLQARYIRCTGSSSWREERTKMHHFVKTTLLAAVLLIGFVSTVDAQVTIGIRIGPPPPPHVVYVPPPRPAPAYVWVDGYWYPAGNHYVWHDGYWTRPPYEGARWVGPRYEGQRYHTGYWEGDQGRVDHDHHWDKDKKKRDYDHDGHDHGHGRGDG